MERPSGEERASASAGPGPGWELAWADEFDRPGLPDERVWTDDVVGDGYPNQELQAYTARRAENARVEDGRLVLEARREPWEGKEYTSARLVTRGKRELLHGRLDVKARLPTGRGVWPAIFLVGADGSKWPSCGELDLAEHVGWDPGRIHFAAHTEAYNHLKRNPVHTTSVLEEPHRRFHVYTLEWTDDRIRMGADGEIHFHYERNGSTDRAVWPYDRPFHVVLQLAVGGWGAKHGLDPAVFPQRLELEWLRCYRRA